MAFEKATIIVAVTSLIVAGLSLYSTIESSKEQSALTQKIDLEQRILNYDEEYQKVIAAHDYNPFLKEGYVKLNKTDRSAVQIVAGLMVQVVDEMVETHDKRINYWEGWLLGFSGPLFCKYPLEAYAVEKRTKLDIGKDRKKIQGNVADAKILEECGEGY